MVEHVDPEVLALVALGEPVPDDGVRGHLATCAQCAAEVSDLAAVVALGRSVPDVGALVPPPASVWDRISAELALSPDVRPDGESQPTAGPAPVLAPVVPLRRRRVPWIAAAAAAGLLVGAVGGAWWAGDDARDPAGPAVVAQAELAPLPGWSASGTARVEQDADGARQLVVTLAGDDERGDFREVWLIDRGVTRLVSVGVLDGSTGSFALPAGLDLEEFPVVDVSEEPFDGDPAHSGDSVVRGILGA